MRPAVALGHASSDSVDQEVAVLAEADQAKAGSQLTAAEHQAAEERGRRYARMKVRDRP